VSSGTIQTTEQKEGLLDPYWTTKSSQYSHQHYDVLMVGSLGLRILMMELESACSGLYTLSARTFLELTSPSVQHLAFGFGYRWQHGKGLARTLPVLRLSPGAERSVLDEKDGRCRALLAPGSCPDMRADELETVVASWKKRRSAICR